MPDIDPAALSKPDPVQTAAPASLSLKTTNTVAPITTTKASKAVNNAQRIDIEPLYANLKSAIGDNWGKYKEALSEFALGKLAYCRTPSQVFSLADTCVYVRSS